MRCPTGVPPPSTRWRDASRVGSISIVRTALRGAMCMQRAASERDELRADLRARAERGAGADRDAIYPLRAATGRGIGTTGTLVDRPAHAWSGHPYLMARSGPGDITGRRGGVRVAVVAGMVGAPGPGWPGAGRPGRGGAGEAELGQPDSGDWAGAVMVSVPVVWWARRACLVEMTCSNSLSACLADGEPPRTVLAADAQVCLARSSPVISCAGRRAAPPAGASEGRTWPPARCRRGHATGRSGSSRGPTSGARAFKSRRCRDGGIVVRRLARTPWSVIFADVA
jgi:hypothetical protein